MVSFCCDFIFQIGCSIWVWLGCKYKNTLEYEIFGLASLIGVGQSAMELSSLTMISNFIGANIGMLNVIFLLYIMLKIFQIFYINISQE